MKFLDKHHDRPICCGHTIVLQGSLGGSHTHYTPFHLAIGSLSFLTDDYIITLTLSELINQCITRKITLGLLIFPTIKHA